jgi:hypothetical protein
LIGFGSFGRSTDFCKRKLWASAIVAVWGWHHSNYDLAPKFRSWPLNPLIDLEMTHSRPVTPVWRRPVQVSKGEILAPSKCRPLLPEQLARRRAGQVRDAASCFHRQRLGDRDFRRVWRFQADLLPSHQAKANFDAAGIAGLVPKKPGPRAPHKAHGEVLAFLQSRLVPGEPVRARELARLIHNELGIEVHPRTIERALKKLPDEHATTLGVFDPIVRHRGPV